MIIYRLISDCSGILFEVQPFVIGFLFKKDALGLYTLSPFSHHLGYLKLKPDQASDNVCIDILGGDTLYSSSSGIYCVR